MLRDFGRQLGRHEKSFGIAGLKDARAISRQWVSVDLGDERATLGGAPEEKPATRPGPLSTAPSAPAWAGPVLVQGHQLQPATLHSRATCT